jgi:hypothetical protein
MTSREEIGATGEGDSAALEGLRREIRILKLYALGLTGALAMVLLAAASRDERKAKFDEIEVGRIDVVEPDGRLALVIANAPRLPGPIVGGKEVDTGRTGPGMLFFNAKGDECGGLVYGTRDLGDGRYEATSHFSFDQYANDQVLFLSYQDDGARRRAGLHVVDRPTRPNAAEVVARKDAVDRAVGEEKERLVRELRDAAVRGEFGAQRVFVGSDDRTATVGLKDPAGRDRVRISVDTAGVPRMDFLDDQGRVTYRLPPE